MSLSKTLSSQLQITRTPLNEEIRRLASYVSWPSSAAVGPSALSRCGFVYEGPGERTRCVACGIVVDNWSQGDRPRDVHRSKSPRCPFVVAEGSSSSQNADDVGSTLQSARSQLEQLRVNEPQVAIRSDGEILTSANLASSSAGERSTSASRGPSVQQPGGTTSSAASAVDRSRPDFVQLRSESVRLSTFHDWPSSAGCIVEPRDLAVAGLFYTGHADRVQCAFCRGCLRNWKSGDVPAQEHRRHFPDCPLMRGAITGNVPCDTSITVVSFVCLWHSWLFPVAMSPSDK